MAPIGTLLGRLARTTWMFGNHPGTSSLVRLLAFQPEPKRAPHLSEVPGRRLTGRQLKTLATSWLNVLRFLAAEMTPKQLTEGRDKVCFMPRRACTTIEYFCYLAVTSLHSGKAKTRAIASKDAHAGDTEPNERYSNSKSVL